MEEDRIAIPPETSESLRKAANVRNEMIENDCLKDILKQKKGKKHQCEE